MYFNILKLIDHNKIIMSVCHISFGSDCSIAYQLNKNILRKYALPFDWILSSNLSGIIDCINDDFEYFFSDLIIKNKSTNFSYIDDIDTFIPNENTNDLVRVHNKKYKITFVHDFYENMSNMKSVIEKYERRIKRFREIMLDSSIKKIIYRICSKKEISKLDELKKCFENKNYVNHEIIFIPYDEFKNTSSWTKDEFDWSTIFK